MTLRGNWGMILLAAFLILYGLSTLVSIGGLSVLVGLLALASGILLLIGR